MRYNIKYKTMDQIEDLLKETMKFKNKQHFSLDIYYDDLADTFVAKIHNYGKELSEKKHFRNSKLVDSLIEAYDYCNNVL